MADTQGERAPPGKHAISEAFAGLSNASVSLRDPNSWAQIEFSRRGYSLESIVWLHKS